MGNKASMEVVLRKVHQLPQIPEVLVRVTRMVEDPSTNANQLATIIALDENLTLELLKLCNSAAYGLNRKISTIKEAVAIVGLKTLKSMVYTILSKSTLNQKVNGYKLDRGGLWRNALTGAVYAKHLCIFFKDTFQSDPELAYTAALLRDVGKIILGEFVEANYTEVENHLLAKKGSFLLAEEVVIGLNHCKVGGKIAEKWGLPEPLISTIEYHHEPSQIAQADLFRLVSAVHLADLYTMLLEMGIGADGLFYSVDQQAMAMLGLPLEKEAQDRLMSRLSSLNGMIDELLKSFSP